LSSTVVVILLGRDDLLGVRGPAPVFAPSFDPAWQRGSTIQITVQVCFAQELLPLFVRPSREMKKKLKWIFGALVVVFALLQLTNPARTNPPVLPGHDVSATNAPPPQVAALLHAACYDCHSYETKWPWYSHVAPMSWLIASDVKGGREHVNFSDWPNDHPDWAARRWERVSEELDYREMPPAKYTLMHPEARLTEIQRKELIQWADAEAAKLKAAGTNQ